MKKTSSQYQQKLSHWFKFCDWASLDHFDNREIVTTLFVSYLYQYTAVPQGVAEQTFTALAHWFALHNIPWRRPYQLAKALKGYRAERPSQKFPRRPLTIHHLVRISELGILDLSTYDGIRDWACLLSHYYFMLRGGEACPYNRSGQKYGVRTGQLRFQRVSGQSNGPLFQAVLDLSKHKGDRFGDRNGEVAVTHSCSIHAGTCGLCHLDRFWRVRSSNPNTRSHPQLFCNSDGTKFIHREFHDLIRRCISEINVRDGILLEVSEYKPHSPRSGRTTDLARAGVQESFIRKSGRWSSKFDWDFSYNKQSFTDVCLVTNRSLAQLNLAAGASIGELIKTAVKPRHSATMPMQCNAVAEHLLDTMQCRAPTVPVPADEFGFEALLQQFHGKKSSPPPPQPAPATSPRIVYAPQPPTIATVPVLPPRSIPKQPAMTQSATRRSSNDSIVSTLPYSSNNEGSLSLPPLEPLNSGPTHDNAMLADDIEASTTARSNPTYNMTRTQRLRRKRVPFVGFQSPDFRKRR